MGRALAVLALWFVSALFFVGLGGLRAYPPPLPQALLVGLLLTLLVSYRVRPGFRAWLHSLPPSYLVAVHLSRFVGVYFLVLYGRGELPYDFAVVGGWGDIFVASLAVLLLLAPSRVSGIASPWLQGWNLLGLVDILFVVATATRLAASSPDSMAALTGIPLGLLPTFLVPVIIFTHVVLVLEGVNAWRRAG